MIRGVVVDDGGRPVAGATVRAKPFQEYESSGASGPDGSFTISLGDGRVEGTALLARSAGGDRVGVFRYEYGLSAAELARPAKISLKPGRKVVVRVSDSSRSPMAGAMVQAAGGFAILDGSATGTDGSAVLNIPIDTKVEWIYAVKSGQGFDYSEYGQIDPYGRTQAGIGAAELPANVVLTLDSPVTVRLKAVDRGDQPLSGIRFYPWLLRKEGRRSQVNVASSAFFATTGPDGVATFDWLPRSNETLTFWPAAKGYAHRRVTVQEGETRPVMAKLTRTEAIRGRVVGPGGAPVAGIRVTATGTGQGMDSGHGRRPPRPMGLTKWKSARAKLTRSTSTRRNGRLRLDSTSLCARASPSTASISSCVAGRSSVGP